jgi:BirA family biotin operon repressor/biotin-[acetyl-CoA-carboxylase] ligase
VGLAAAEAIRAAIGLGTGSGPNSGPDAGPKIDLRWPNDLLIGAGKVGGILVETKTSGGEVNFAVAGIGINVHQRSFAPDLATPATSLDLETGVPSDRSSSLGWKTGARISRQALLAALLKSLEREARGLLDPEAAALIPQRVERASTWMRGQRIEVHGPQACVGVTAGLDEHGFLLVRTGDGVVTVQTGGIRSVETDFGKTD